MRKEDEFIRRGDALAVEQDSQAQYNRIMAIPAANVKPVLKSNWYRKRSWSIGFGMGEEYGYYWGCGNCEYTVKDGYEKCDWNFCPNCGADMRREAKDE